MMNYPEGAPGAVAPLSRFRGTCYDENLQDQGRSPHGLDRDSIHRPLAKQLRMNSSMPSRPADTGQTLDLPPGYTLVPLREFGDAFVHGCAIAADAGAGTLVWVRRYDLVEFAVVLEPDEPLAVARRTIYAGLCALPDALAAHAPPETLISFEWPDAIFVEGGLVGGVQLAWAESEETAVPDWLVFGAMLRPAGRPP